MDSRNWTVTGINIYPIKSCAGTQVLEARVGVHGLEYDRRFMVVEKGSGRFVAQRSSDGLGIAIRSLSQIRPTIKPDGYIELSAPEMEVVRFFPFSSGGRMRQVQIWKSVCNARVMTRHTNDWFTEFLSRERPGQYQLVTMWPEFIRRAKIGYSQLHFADAYPFMVMSEETRDELNRRKGGEPVPWNRFRPSFTLAGGLPHDEDRLDRMVINGVELEGKTLCERCSIPCTDQETGEVGKEPNATLSKYRRGEHIHSPWAMSANKIYFGRNFNHLSTGRISVGDVVERSGK